MSEIRNAIENHEWKSFKTAKLRGFQEYEDK